MEVFLAGGDVLMAKEEITYRVVTGEKTEAVVRALEDIILQKTIRNRRK